MANLEKSSKYKPKVTKTSSSGSYEVKGPGAFLLIFTKDCYSATILGIAEDRSITEKDAVTVLTKTTTLNAVLSGGCGVDVPPAAKQAVVKNETATLTNAGTSVASDKWTFAVKSKATCDASNANVANCELSDDSSYSVEGTAPDSFSGTKIVIVTDVADDSGNLTRTTTDTELDDSKKFSGNFRAVDGKKTLVSVAQPASTAGGDVENQSFIVTLDATSVLPPDMQIILTWDNKSDFDLHALVAGHDNEEVYWGKKNHGFGDLAVDNSKSFGPEVINLKSIAGGEVKIGVQAWNAPKDATVSVRIITSSYDETFTSEDGTFNKPKDWWIVGNFTKDGACTADTCEGSRPGGTDASGSGYFIAVGKNGTLLHSSGGETWEAASNSGAVTTQTLNAVVHGDGTNWVAVGAGGTIVSSSDDGVTWATATSGTTYALNDVAYGAGKFIAVGAFGLILSSADGSSWTDDGTGAGTGSGDSFNGIEFDSSTGKFLAVGKTTWNSDGATWTKAAAPPAAANDVATNSAGRFVITGSGADTFYTDDLGATWSADMNTSTFVNGAHGVDFGGGFFFVGGEFGYCMVSPDATSWTEVDAVQDTRRKRPAPIRDVAVSSGGTIVVVGADSYYTSEGKDFTVSTSIDAGITWKNVATSVEEQLYGVAAK